MEIRVTTTRDSDKGFQVAVPGIDHPLVCRDFADIRVAVRDELRLYGHDTQDLRIYIDQLPIRTSHRVSSQYPLAASLEELPFARRWNLIWASWGRLAHLEGLDPFDPREAPPCYLGVSSVYSVPAARLGADSLHHLVSRDGRNGAGPCDNHARRAKVAGALLDPTRIPRNQRCPQVARHWPPYLNPDSRLPMDRARYAVATALGEGCSLCRGRPARVLDHDHYTGLVRGYLCTDCNGLVDRCRHLEICPAVEYLNTPSACHLAITYPEHRKRIRSKRYRERAALMATYGLAPPWYTC